MLFRSGELGFESFKRPLVRLLLEESLCHATLPSMQHSALEYYVYTVRLPADRRRLLRYARQHYRPAHAFLWGPPPRRPGAGGGGGARAEPTPEKERKGREHNPLPRGRRPMGKQDSVESGAGGRGGARTSREGATERGRGPGRGGEYGETVTL